MTDVASTSKAKQRGKKRKSTADDAHIENTATTADEPVEFEVEKIVGHQRSQAHPSELSYKVRWKGYDEAADTMQTEEDLANAPEMVTDYWRIQRNRQSKSYRSVFGVSDLNGIVEGDTNAAKAFLQTTVKRVCDETGGGVESESITKVAGSGNEYVLHFRLKPPELKARQLDELKMWEAEMNARCADAGEAPLTVENVVDDAAPPIGFTYITDYMPMDGVIIPSEPILYCECDSQKCGKGGACCPAINDSEFAYRGKTTRVLPNTDRQPIHECTKNCKCDASCANRVVQKGRKFHLKIAKTLEKGWGVVAVYRIPKHAFVTEYVGEVITLEEATHRATAYDESGSTYLFDLDLDGAPQYTVDAKYYGNVAHFINHSCDPNMVVRNVWTNCQDVKLPRLAFFAARDVQKGEELTFDYDPTRADVAEDNDFESSPSKEPHRQPGDLPTTPRKMKTNKVACRCGAKGCRKVLWVFGK